MSISLRQNKIQKHLRKAGSASVTALAQDLRVSEMTIRRDLAALEKKGLAVRTFGGALAPDDRPMEFSFGERMKVRSAQKEAIGRKAAETVKEGETVLIDTGTTALCVARALKHFDNLTVVTGSLPVAWELRGAPGIETILLGGRVRRTSQDIYGPLAEMNLENPVQNDPSNREILMLGGGPDPLGVRRDEVLGSAFENRSDLRQLELTEKLRTAELRVQRRRRPLVTRASRPCREVVAQQF